MRGLFLIGRSWGGEGVVIYTNILHIIVAI